MVSDGRLTRFTELPITVYVEGLEIQGKEYADDLRYALKEWEKRSDGILSFQLVNLPDGADILVSWVRTLIASDKDHPMGIAELQRTGNDKFHVEMNIYLRNTKTHKRLTHDEMKTVLLHEFGHAIGLWGHSKNEADIMYYAADALHPTLRDVNTLKQLYSHELNYSLHAESIKAIREEMISKPEDAKLFYLLGTIYADQAKYDSAIDSFRKCLDLDPEFHKASAELASAYRTSGQDQAALVEYLSLAESDPSAMLHNVIGALYFEKRDTAKAVQHFKKALKLERTYQPAKRNLYKIYLNRGKELINAKMYYAAVELLLDGIDFFPDKPELHNTLGTAYSKTGRFPEAIHQYILALRINPAFTTAKNNLASCYNNQGVKYAEAGQWEKALEAYTEALRLMPGMAEAEKNISAAYWNRAVRLSSARRDREAIKAYQLLLDYEPDNEAAHNNLGAVYFRTGDYELAIAEFTNALKFNPGFRDIKDNLAIAHHTQASTLIEKKDYSQAARELEKGLKFAPDNVNLHMALSQVYDRLRRWDDAIQHINKIKALEPDSTIAGKVMANLNIHRGNLSLYAKDYDKALEYYRNIPAEFKPPLLHNNIGYLYIMKKMYLEAIYEYNKVLETIPDDKTAQQNLESIESSVSKQLSDNGSQKSKNTLVRVRLSLAVFHIGHGNFDKAKDTLESAVELKPQGRELRHLLADGCKKLAEKFTRRNERTEAMELMGWATQLRSNQ